MDQLSAMGSIDPIYKRQDMPLKNQVELPKDLPKKNLDFHRRVISQRVSDVLPRKFNQDIPAPSKFTESQMTLRNIYKPKNLNQEKDKIIKNIGSANISINKKTARKSRKKKQSH